MASIAIFRRPPKFELLQHIFYYNTLITQQQASASSPDSSSRHTAHGEGHKPKISFHFKSHPHPSNITRSAYSTFFLMVKTTH
jgi:hypothetical protein